jgi:hypothetical protein
MPEFNDNSSDNPFEVPAVRERGAADDARRRPNIFLQVVGILLAFGTGLIAFVMTFFITCVGLVSLSGGEPGREAIVPICLMTAFAASLLTVWGVRKLVHALQR